MKIVILHLFIGTIVLMARLHDAPPRQLPQRLAALRAWPPPKSPARALA